MLVLSRRTHEAIRISDSIHLTVLAIDSGVVKLGIEAPAEISVHRAEVYERIQEENRRAAKCPGVDLGAMKRLWSMRGKGGISAGVPSH
jgi:carbon storage regulator